jgi:hypothetical protein
MLSLVKITLFDTIHRKILILEGIFPFQIIFAYGPELFVVMAL